MGRPPLRITEQVRVYLWAFSRWFASGSDEASRDRSLRDEMRSRFADLDREQPPRKRNRNP